MSIESSKIRIEKSINDSGEIRNSTKIDTLKEKHYYVKNYDLDGDAPKEFIKVYYYQKNSGIRKDKPKSWFPFIAKSAEKWYPHESVIEYIINQIGSELGLLMNETELYKINTQYRFLSKYFLKKNESLIHGAEICGQYLEDNTMAREIAINKGTARELFTFEFICEAIRSIFPKEKNNIIKGLVKMITFDGLVGNNDRHFYNWGVIINIRKSSKTKPTFSPIYDSARGLFWNFSDDNIKKQYDNHKKGGKKIVTYIKNARPRISVEVNKDANHFELIKEVKYNGYKEIIDDLSSITNENKIVNFYVKRYSQHFIKERNELILYLIRERFKQIREL